MSFCRSSCHWCQALPSICIVDANIPYIVDNSPFWFKEKFLTHSNGVKGQTTQVLFKTYQVTTLSKLK